jgi:hypothetical protein
MTDINFNCPKCRGSVAVDSSAAGRNANCPHCKQPITIPNPSSDDEKLGRSSKECPFCAEQILVSAIKCKHCGEFLNRPPPLSPTQAARSIDPIWNPLAIVLWSLLFGPVWGVTLASLNWKRLGDPVRARRTSHNWTIGAIGVTIVANKSTSDLKIDAMTSLGVSLVFLWGFILLWGLVSHRAQIRHVKTLFASSYPRRSWLWPLTIGVGLYVLIILLQMLVDSMQHLQR